jgi:diguanylate cyclase (GGDEF)-like protein
MTITKKAFIIVIGNIVITFVVALLARNIIINPRLFAIEHAADQKDIARFEQALELYKDTLEGRVKRIYSAGGILQSLDNSIDWQPVIGHLAKIGGYEELDYFILADHDGSNALLQAGELVDRFKTPPSATALKEILEHIIPRTSVTKGAVISGLYDSPSDGPIVYAAGNALWTSDELPSMYIAIRRLNQNMIPEFTKRLGLSATIISESEFSNLTARSSSKIGARNSNNTLLTIIKGDNNKALLHLKFITAPRAFDDQAFSPTFTVSMLVATVSWSLVFLYLYHNTISPIRRVSRTMKMIRLTNNYNNHLDYKIKDEIGTLVDECNELLKHVAQHTELLEKYSYQDALTGLGNRRHFQEQFKQYWRIAKRKKLNLNAITFDLDYFKQYNDTYGHDGGDIALQNFAKILMNSFVRDDDVIARTGGEEFIVLLLGSDSEYAVQLAQAVIDKLYSQHIPHSASPIADRLTVSSGVASIIPNQHIKADTLISRADSALYHAKGQGRNRVVSDS